MAVAFKPQHLKRYKEIAQLLIKHGRNGMFSGNGEQALDQTAHGRPDDTTRQAEELARELEAMGPVFIKLGQILSSRADLLPEPYLIALARLQDSMEPFPVDQVEQIVEEDLGVRLSKAFMDFEREPIGVASLGQVHRAALHDGRPVVVKAQRPDIRPQIAEDFEALDQIAGLIDAHTDAGRRFNFSEILDEFRRTLLRELDYRQEARHLIQIGTSLAEFPNILVPSPVEDYSSSRVLTMDYIRGTKITKMSPIGRLEMDGRELAEELFHAYLKQILVDGLFHADPHPGNVLITEDRKIALIDLGMVGHITPDMQDQLLKLLISMSEGKSSEAAEVAIKIGEPFGDFDQKKLERSIAQLVEENEGATISTMRVGTAVLDFSRISAESGIRMPTELTMLGKCLLNLEEIGRTLDPHFDPAEAVRKYSTDITMRRLRQTMSSGNILNGTLETRELLSRGPERLNRILELAAGNDLRVQVLDEKTLIEGFRKVANRIAMGVVVGSLIIGAAMLMRVQTSFTLFGYPGLAILLFLAAAGVGFWLVVDIILADRRDGRSKPAAT